MSENLIHEIARLTALAKRFAAKGQMNLNKLVEAAVYAYVRRAGWQYHPQITTDSMQAELADAIQALRQNGASPDLVAAMEIGLRALQSERGTDLLREEAPDVFVCRACGHTALGQPPEHCPDCGEWPGQARKQDFYRTGQHPEFGELTILRQAAYMAFHEQVHLPEIEAVCGSH